MQVVYARTSNIDGIASMIGGVDRLRMLTFAISWPIDIVLAVVICLELLLMHVQDKLLMFL